MPRGARSLSRPREHPPQLTGRSIWLTSAPRLATKPATVAHAVATPRRSRRRRDARRSASNANVAVHRTCRTAPRTATEARPLLECGFPPAHTASAEPALSMEASRKHGPFDSRYPLIRHKPSPRSRSRRGEARADWEGFLARFYPNSRRHDFDVLAAYESYRNDSSRRESDGSAAADETERWEGEGGAVAERSRRAQRSERRVRTRAV
jgi:hypothetical protein